MTSVDPTAMTGLEQLQREAARPADTPTIRRLLGMRFDEIEHGRVVMSLQTRADFSNPLGILHGGIAATLLDSVLGCAVHSTLPAGVSYTTLELKVNYIRGVDLDGQTMIGTGTVVHAGRRVATAEGRIVDGNGKLVAHAVTTCLILSWERVSR